MCKKLLKLSIRCAHVDVETNVETRAKDKDVEKKKIFFTFRFNLISIIIAA